jgi:hypothetical protein
MDDPAAGIILTGRAGGIGQMTRFLRQTAVGTGRHQTKAYWAPRRTEWTDAGARRWQAGRQAEHEHRHGRASQLSRDVVTPAAIHTTEMSIETILGNRSATASSGRA